MGQHANTHQLNRCNSLYIRLSFKLRTMLRMPKLLAAVTLILVLCAPVCQGATDWTVLGRSLTATVLQYAMCSREANLLRRSAIDTEPVLASICREYARGFQQEPGVEVIGAGSARVNGWYALKEKENGPPAE